MNSRDIMGWPEAFGKGMPRDVEAFPMMQTRMFDSVSAPCYKKSFTTRERGMNGERHKETKKEDAQAQAQEAPGQNAPQEQVARHAMTSGGLFTPTDLSTISRAAHLAEKLTTEYFSLDSDEWRRASYAMFTRKEVGDALHSEDVFAQLVFYRTAASRKKGGHKREAIGIVLQDPIILQALLRSYSHDLWTLALFILTHELTHIVRFRRFGVDVFTDVQEREIEEKVVYSITREILSGVANTECLLNQYQTPIHGVGPNMQFESGRPANADL